MNLIEQLKQTPKWKEFEQWWNNTYCKTLRYLFLQNTKEENCKMCFKVWCDFPFEMQEGVFKKYIEQDSVIAKYRTHYNISVLKEESLIQEDFETFEKLILWYFNN
jgi:hypothetical protein